MVLVGVKKFSSCARSKLERGWVCSPCMWLTAEYRGCMWAGNTLNSPKQEEMIVLFRENIECLCPIGILAFSTRMVHEVMISAF